MYKVVDMDNLDRALRYYTTGELYTEFDYPIYNIFPLRYPNDFTLLEDMARAGDHSAQCLLGKMYLYGYPPYIKTNVDISIEYFSESSKQNNLQAIKGLYKIGCSYTYPFTKKSTNYKTNYSKAFSLIEKAAHSGLPQAQYHLAILHWYGLGFYESKKRYKYWIKVAQDNKCVPAKVTYIKLNGIYYYNGKGWRDRYDSEPFVFPFMLDFITRNNKSEILSNASDIEMVDSLILSRTDFQYILADYLYEGLTVGRNLRESMRYAYRSFCGGFPPAETLLENIVRCDYPWALLESDFFTQVDLSKFSKNEFLLDFFISIMREINNCFLRSYVNNCERIRRFRQRDKESLHLAVFNKYGIGVPRNRVKALELKSLAFS